MSWIALIIALIGTIGNIYRKRWHFILWTITNAYWALYNLAGNNNPLAVLFAVYFCLSIWGWFKWGKI